MAYNQNIPDITVGIDQARTSIEDNFKAIKTVVELNHVAFNAADQGKHKFVTLPDQVAAPTTAANEIAIYSKDATGSKLYMRLESDGTEYNLTPSTAGHAASGYELLPSGLKLNWGTGTLNTGISTVTVNYAAGGNFVTAAYSPNVSPSSIPSESYARAVLGCTATTSAITVVRDSHHVGGSVSFYFMVIGK
jgi:hypothetical protein